MGIGIGADVAELVELRVVAGGNDPTIANQHRRVCHQCCAEPPVNVVVLTQVCGQRLQQRRIRRQHGADVRQQAERRAQLGQVPGPRALQCDPAQNAFEVAGLPQQPGQRVAVTLAEGVDGLVTGLQRRHVAQWPIQPAAQQPAAHRCGAAVHHARQRMFIPAGQAGVYLEVAAGHRVHQQCIGMPLRAEAGEMRERPALRVAHIAQQAAGSADRRTEFSATVTVQVSRTELRAQRTGGRLLIEVPGREVLHASGCRRRQRIRGTFFQQQFRGLQSRQFGGESVPPVELRDREAPGAQVQPRQPEAHTVLANGGQQVVAPAVQQRLVRQRAGRQHADDFALHRSLAGGRVADLFANGHGPPKFDQPLQITIDGMKRHTTHWNGRRRRIDRARST